MKIKKIQRIITFLLSFETLLFELTEEFFRENEPMLVAMNQGQLWEGKRADGTALPDYTPFTKRIKAEKGQPFDRMTLKDTGDFYEGFFVKIDSTSKTVVFSSKDEKTVELTTRYGRLVFGLSSQNKPVVQNRLKLFILGKIKKAV